MNQPKTKTQRRRGTKARKSPIPPLNHHLEVENAAYNAVMAFVISGQETPTKEMVDDIPDAIAMINEKYMKNEITKTTRKGIRPRQLLTI